MGHFNTHQLLWPRLSTFRGQSFIFWQEKRRSLHVAGHWLPVARCPLLVSHFSIPDPWFLFSLSLFLQATRLPPGCLLAVGCLCSPVSFPYKFRGCFRYPAISGHLLLLLLLRWAYLRLCGTSMKYWTGNKKPLRVQKSSSVKAIEAINVEIGFLCTQCLLFI